MVFFLGGGEDEESLIGTAASCENQEVTLCVRGGGGGWLALFLAVGAGWAEGTQWGWGWMSSKSPLATPVILVSWGGAFRRDFSKLNPS